MSTTMTFSKAFDAIKQCFAQTDSTKMQKQFAFQCNITGPGAGAFYITHYDGKLSVEPFDYRDRDAQFWATADTYMKIATGQVSYDSAVDTGILHVQGNLDTARQFGCLASHASGSSVTPKVRHVSSSSDYFHDTASTASYGDTTHLTQ
jgi:putative sterol carrier protein